MNKLSHLKIKKILSLLIVVTVIASNILVIQRPQIVAAAATLSASASDVVAQIDALPSTYSGIPLMKGAVADVNTSTNIGAVAVDETVEFQGQHPLKVTASVAGGASEFGKKFSEARNLSNLTNIELLMNFYETNPSTKLYGIRVDLVTNDNNFFYNYIGTTYWSKQAGVCRIRVNFGDFKKYGAPSISNITGVNIRFEGKSGMKPSLGLYSYDFNAASKPKVMLTFDDGWQDNYDHAFPILQAYGMQATTYAVSNFAQGSDPNYMKSATLDSLYNAGWDVGNHSSAHQNYGTNIFDPVAMAQNYWICREYLLSRGYTRSGDDVWGGFFVKRHQIPNR